MRISKMSKSYFPIRVVYTKTNEEVIVIHPNDLRNGEAFKVLECNAHVNM